uniref:B3 domain-containing transcription factor ABI3-like isoform X1 n=1 Tax=Tanacetum cinerariifolium TaxID=118510 RepID=A0A6L2M7P0_TANCI|nr:B3 domain-containing transcription factor ABI3-like isoform X1 [Tanacetum cinerariifolium]
MRNIKLKRSTIESASKRLGSSKEGKKQLLKLILEWVQQNQLQRKNSGGDGAGCKFSATDATTTNTQYPLQQYQGLTPAPQQLPIAATPTPPPPFDCNNWVPPNDMWIPPTVGYPSYMTDQTAKGMPLVGSVPPQASYSYTGGGGDHYMNPYNNTGSGEYQVLESAPSWNPSQITMAGSPYSNQFLDVGNNYGPQVMSLAPGYPDQYQYNPQVYAAGGGGGQRGMRLGSSATKEARKKRMARQRKTYFQHHHHSRQSQHNHMASGDHHQHAHTMLVDDTCSGKSHGGNWLYWPSPPSATTLPPPPMEASHKSSARPQQSETRLVKQISISDKRTQGLKTEKNLKFLLQKVLKQSDVGSLGRIVLPKLIRGVKVRQPASGKSEIKKPVKRSYRSITQPGRSSSSPPAKITAI